MNDRQRDAVWAEFSKFDKVDIPIFAVDESQEKLNNGYEAATEYTKKGNHKKNWVSPDYAYSLEVENEKGGFQMIFLNTELDLKSSWNQYLEEDFVENEQIMYKPRNSWDLYPLKFLVGHRPLYSTFTRVSSIRDREAQTKVETVLRHKRHDVYISGHLPVMECLQDNDKFDYFIIGGGGEKVSKRKKEKNEKVEEKFAENVYGFALFEYNFAEKTEKIIYYKYESRKGGDKLQGIPKTIKHGEMLTKNRRFVKAHKEARKNARVPRRKVQSPDQGYAKS
uniref:AlNc14C30G2836 protein n=1 Tax=Albugo laibachii Nc14 TaxID=890382 RepID=F0W7N1_9STRA|nr:AlNc14C30G2836 [Albugo laibachii Nc14]|eukprot:CCA17132.1 AlNc14C30G2836 [Albugo laibachii Nc14]